MLYWNLIVKQTICQMVRFDTKFSSPNGKISTKYFNCRSLGVINMCFMLLFRDLIRLFACYNDGIINLLEKYFDMNKKQCKDALDLYKRFLVRMDKVGEFLKVAEVRNIILHYFSLTYILLNESFG